MAMFFVFTCYNTSISDSPECFCLQLNHFQAVIITDGVYTFVKFNYPEDGINWATPGITSDDSEMEINLKLDGGYGWYPMAIGGFSSGDYNNGINVTRDYVTGSNQIQMMDIDNVAGNYPGKEIFT